MKLIIPIAPVPQGRPRFARRGNFVTTYDDPKSKRFKNEIKTYVNRLDLAPFDKYKPLKVKIMYFIPLLKSFSKKRVQEAEKGQYLPVKRPDLDNYTKGVLDALNGLLFHDDGQVVKLYTEKYYSEQPRIEIEISEVIV